MPEAQHFEPERALPVAALGWVAAVLAQALVLTVVAGGDSADTVPIPQLAIAIVVGWGVLCASIVVASRTAGSGAPLADTGFTIRPVDLLGLPLGVVCQLVLIPVVYAPLRLLAPDTFTNAELEERAQRLIDRADGGGVVVLWVVVVFGAPVVEELFYRGLIQRSVLSRSVPLALVTSSVVFGIIHFSPVELPGLVAFGAVLGVLAWRTDRLGGAIVTHAAFNATALVALS